MVSAPREKKGAESSSKPSVQQIWQEAERLLASDETAGVLQRKADGTDPEINWERRLKLQKLLESVLLRDLDYGRIIVHSHPHLVPA